MGAAAPSGFSGSQGCSARLLREEESALASEKGRHQHLFLAVPRRSNGAKDKEEAFTVHPCAQGHVPAPEGPSRWKGFLLVASSPLMMA